MTQADTTGHFPTSKKPGNLIYFWTLYDLEGFTY